MERPLKNRDVNWLYFNERVLLEAADKSVPLLERLKFLAIFSSNLDEYFKVRIAQLRQLKSVDKKLRKKLMLKPNKTLKFILKTIKKQQDHFGVVIQDTLEELKQEGIFIKNAAALSPEQKGHIKHWFEEHVQQDCHILAPAEHFQLQDGKLYLVVALKTGTFNFVSIPVEKHGRFIPLPGDGHQFMYLEDVVASHMTVLFPSDPISENYLVKLSRDAELYLEDDYTDTALVEKIYRSLGKRDSGQATRFLYDNSMPTALKSKLEELLELGEADMIPGGAHHNLSDFFAFPTPENKEQLTYAPLPPLDHPFLDVDQDIFACISKKDQLVHFPYQKFDAVEGFLTQAATDPGVTCIKISLYRIAKTSTLTDALLKALEHGKEVILFVEAQARFDEENNIRWGRIFEEKGATVIFSVPNIKVHSKIALIEREEDNSLRRYAYIGTGNFNAKTAKLYCDHGLFTAHKRITRDLSEVFLVLERKLIIPKLKHLLVSPFSTRSTLLELIQNEIDHARHGRTSGITLKMNSLEDSKMIRALYKASEAGVPEYAYWYVDFLVLCLGKQRS